MPNLVTVPPTIIDSTYFSRFALNYKIPVGPWFKNSNSFLGLLGNDGNDFAAVEKSTDGGASWAVQDYAHAYYTINSQLLWDFDPATGIAYFVDVGPLPGVTPADNAPVIGTLDTNTGLFGAISTPFPGFGAGTFIMDIAYVHTAAAEHFLFSWIDAASVNTISHVTYSAGVWSVPTTLKTFASLISAANFPTPIKADPAGRLHFTYNDPDNPGGTTAGGNLTYAQVASFSPVSLGSWGTFSPNLNGMLPGYLGDLAILGNTVAVIANITDKSTITAFLGVGLTSPSWTPSVVYVEPDQNYGIGDNGNYVTSVAWGLGICGLYAHWIVSNLYPGFGFPNEVVTIAGAPALNKIRRSLYVGNNLWATKQDVFDLNGLIPATGNAIENQTLLGLSVAQNGANWMLVTSLFTNPPTPDGSDTQATGVVMTYPFSPENCGRKFMPQWIKSSSRPAS